MSKFQHYSNFPKDKNVQSYLFPNVCFACRKSYKKPKSEEKRLCPECRIPMEVLGRKFSAPKSTNLSQSKKIRYLVEHGFFFQPVYEQREDGGGNILVGYPRDLSEAKSFVDKYQKQAKSNAY